MTQAEHIRGHLDELHRRGFTAWDALETEHVEAWNKANGIELVNVISAKELTETERNGFEAKLTNADIHYRVDPSLIAGVRIEWPDRVLDVSVTGMIKDLKKTL